MISYVGVYVRIQGEGSVSFGEYSTGVNFINIVRTHFSYESAFLPKRNWKKAAEKTFVQKMRA